MIPLLLFLAQAAAPDQKARIEGTVTNATTGAPLNKVGVTLQTPNAALNAVTTADGKFALDASPGEYTIRAVRVGYLEAREKPVNLANADRRIIDFKLIPQSIVSGRVVDEDGDPVTDAAAGLEHVLVAGEKRIWYGFTESAVVNGEGGFTFSGLKPGDYILTAQPSPQLWPTNPLIARFVQTWFPGVRESSAASVIHLAPGAEIRNLELRMAKGATYRVRGKIAGEVNAVPSRLLLNSVGGGGSYTAEIARGGFEFLNVPPGSYLLQSNATPSFMTSPNPKAYVLQRVEVGDHDLDDLIATAIPQVELTGAFHLDDVKSFAYEMAVLLPQHFSVPGMTMALPQNRTGEFLFRVPPDEFEIRFESLPEGAYVKSVRFAGREIGRMLDLTSGAPAPLEITLAMNAAEIAGTVRDDHGDPLPFWTLLLWHGDGPAEVRQSKRDGSFDFKNLAPGEYHIASWDDPDAAASLTDFYKPFEPRATTVTVHEGSRETVEIKPIPLQ